MKIHVKAKTKAKIEKVEKITTLFSKPNDENYVVSVKDPPVGGLANYAIIKALAKHFGVPQTSIKITHGEKSKNKIVGDSPLTEGWHPPPRRMTGCSSPSFRGVARSGGVFFGPNYLFAPMSL